MKTKELNQLKEKNVKDLNQKVLDLKKKIALDYMKIRVGQEKNLKMVRNAKKEVAQILTILGQKEKEIIKS